MRSLAERKKILVSPAGATPTNWPTGWQFPAPPWPPGFPMAWKNDEVVRLSLGVLPFYEDGKFLISCVCIDAYAEDTDILNGLFTEVRVIGTDGELIRMRKAPEDPWSRIGLFQIRLYNWLNFGIHEILYLDAERATPEAMVTIDLYGVLRGPQAAFSGLKVRV